MYNSTVELISAVVNFFLACALYVYTASVFIITFYSFIKTSKTSKFCNQY